MISQMLIDIENLFKTYVHQRLTLNEEGGAVFYVNNKEYNPSESGSKPISIIAESSIASQTGIFSIFVILAIDRINRISLAPQGVYLPQEQWVKLIQEAYIPFCAVLEKNAALGFITTLEEKGEKRLTHYQLLMTMINEFELILNRKIERDFKSLDDVPASLFGQYNAIKIGGVRYFCLDGIINFVDALVKGGLGYILGKQEDGSLGLQATLSAQSIYNHMQIEYQNLFDDAMKAIKTISSMPQHEGKRRREKEAELIHLPMQPKPLGKRQRRRR